MKVWGVLCLLGCFSDLNAQSNDVPDIPDEKPGIGVISHVEKDAPQEDSKESKADLSTLLKETSDNPTLSQEELEKPEPFLIVTTDQSSPPGGGVRFIDPKIEKMLPLLKETPWWQRWWNAVTEWFSGENSD